MERHPYLVMDEYHLAHTDAWELVVSLVQARGARQPPGGWPDLTLTWTNRDGKVLRLPFEKAVDQARRTGIVRDLHGDFDAGDYVFGGSHAAPVQTSGSGHSMKLRAEYAGYSKELTVPCRYAAIEGEMVEDILYHRTVACSHSDADDLVDTCRSFRAYLFSCVAIVDAFIQRYVLMYAHTHSKPVDVEAFRSAVNLEARIALWLETFAHASLTDLNESHEWYEFKRLLKSRNELLHARHAFLGHNIRDIARELNYVRDGVGGLLLLLRYIEGERTLGFIERLRTAPRITFSAPTQRLSVMR